MSNQVQAFDVHQVLSDTRDSFESIASNHKLVTWREESEFALQSVNKNPFLLKCNPYTIQNAIKNVAAIGLTLNPSLGYSYLVPEYNTQTKQQECNLRISFQGLVKLVTDSGVISMVKAEIVKQGDTFIYNGAFELPTHKIDFKADRGNPEYVYCIAITQSGMPIVDFMPWDEVLKIRAQAKISTVWDKWPEEMAKKAIIKRAYKQWPKAKSTEKLGEAIAAINEMEGSNFETVSEDLKAQFIDYLENKSEVEFYGFIKFKLNEEQYCDLYNSGEDGKKIELKKAFTAKEKAGIAVANSIIADFNENGDEALENLTELEKKVIMKLIENQA